MRIAVSLTDGHLAPHFGECEKFALLDVDWPGTALPPFTELEAPEHTPGALPAWLAERGVNVVIAGNMGPRAQALLAAAGVEVITGAPLETAAALVRRYLDGTLETVENNCDHSARHSCGHGS